MRVCVVILNYRRAALTIDCLRALAVEMQGHEDRCAVCIDNGSDDSSGDEIAAAIEANDWTTWARFIKSPVNLGFAGGNNLALTAVKADAYLLLNSDARVVPGMLSILLDTLANRPDAGAVGPRLQGPDGEPQVSCFRYRTPLTEFLDSAGVGVLDRLFGKCIIPMGVFDEAVEPPWMSFACILIRREVIDRIGPMDDGYFMYFEDIDYARRIRAAGWTLVHEPRAKVVHLRGGTSAVKAAMKSRRRIPVYYFESRSRYYGTYYGGVPGVCLANVCWILGRTIGGIRDWLLGRGRSSCECEAQDNWINWLQPLRPRALPQGGEL